MSILSDNEILNYALQNGIIDINTIQTQIEMNERKRYLEMHNYNVWKGNDGNYHTYLPDATKKNGRRHIKKSTEKSLQDTIVDYYKNDEEEPCMESVFYEWLDRKLAFGEIEKQTYERYEVDFKRFFKDTKIANIKFRYITEFDLEEFIKISIHKKKLTAKAYSNMKTLINGIFKYAKKRGYTNISITSFIGDLDISNKVFCKNVKTDMQCVFCEEEMNKIIKYAWENPILGNMGYLLSAYTGMRVGEIVALKWEDITEDYIYVHRTQIRYHNDSGKEVYEIRDTPKTEAGIRKVAIVKNLRPVLRQLRKINPFTEYVFEKNGVPVTKHVLDMCLYRTCDKLQIPRRGMHVLRKTYATRLLNSNVDEAIIINQMGHTDIKTTKDYYYYNDKTFVKMADLIQTAINY